MLLCSLCDVLVNKSSNWCRTSFVRRSTGDLQRASSSLHQMFLWVAQNVCNVVVLRVRSSSFQIRPSGKSIISISRTHTTFEQQDQALHHIFDSTIQDIKMAYMTQSAAAAFTMFLALASNVYITFVLQGYIYYKFGPRNIACIIASHSITCSRRC
jgi:hypothetical protein